MVSPEEVQAQEGAIYAADREPGLEIGFIPSFPGSCGTWLGAALISMSLLAFLKDPINTELVQAVPWPEPEAC